MGKHLRYCTSYIAGVRTQVMDITPCICTHALHVWHGGTHAGIASMSKKTSLISQLEMTNVVASKLTDLHGP